MTRVREIKEGDLIMWNQNVYKIPLLVISINFWGAKDILDRELAGAVLLTPSGPRQFTLVDHAFKKIK